MLPVQRMSDARPAGWVRWWAVYLGGGEAGGRTVEVQAGALHHRQQALLACRDNRGHPHLSSPSVNKRDYRE